MAKYCVIARFDDKANERLEKWKGHINDLAEFDGTKGWPLHMTLACYEDINVSDICQWTESYSSQNKPIKINISSLGVFCHDKRFPTTDVIYATPTFSKGLTSFYYGFHENFDEFCGEIGWSYSMKYGQPAFHISLTLCKVEDFDRIFKYIYNDFESFDAQIVALEVYSIPMELIARYELK